MDTFAASAADLRGRLAIVVDCMTTLSSLNGETLLRIALRRESEGAPRLSSFTLLGEPGLRTLLRLDLGGFTVIELSMRRISLKNAKQGTSL